jgi:sugar phosphate isomerase/epimerase
VSAREPRFSVSEITTFHQTFDEDLATYREAGAQGIGIWEFKLGEDRGSDAEAVAKLRDSGLSATTCIPGTLSIYPVPFPGPEDPEQRTRELCGAIERLAAFEPAVILCLTGHPGGAPTAEARRVVVDGLRRAAKVAQEHGVLLGLEPLHRELYGHWSMISNIPETLELIAEVGEPSLRLLYDVYHVWDTDDIVEHTRRHARDFAPSVHICDWRADTRNDFDRALPGEGVMDLPALFGALDEGGFEGWFDLEIFSDDGSFTDRDFEDSLWKQDPLEVLARAKAGFHRAWEARKTPA